MELRHRTSLRMLAAERCSSWVSVFMLSYKICSLASNAVQAWHGPRSVPKHKFSSCYSFEERSPDRLELSASVCITTSVDSNLSQRSNLLHLFFIGRMLWPCKTSMLANGRCQRHSLCSKHEYASMSHTVPLLSRTRRNAALQWKEAVVPRKEVHAV